MGTRLHVFARWTHVANVVVVTLFLIISATASQQAAAQSSSPSSQAGASEAKSTVPWRTVHDTVTDVQTEMRFRFAISNLNSPSANLEGGSLVVSVELTGEPERIYRIAASELVRLEDFKPLEKLLGTPEFTSALDQRLSGKSVALTHDLESTGYQNSSKGRQDLYPVRDLRIKK